MSYSFTFFRSMVLGNGFVRIATLLIAVSLTLPPLLAQTMTNAGFQGGVTGWNGCPLEINPESVYGGGGGNLVAEVDGDNDPASTADDKQLCQTISGFTVGAIYELSFQAARRQGGPTPSTVSVNVNIDGAIDALVTRTGSWSLTYEYITFTATATTHTLHITPNFTVSYGMLFDNFGIAMVSGLPVELLRFDARREAGEVMLDWATASEQDNDHFMVERSADGVEWGSIAQVSGAGQSQSYLVYSAIDHAPVPGTSYYRLRQVELDGSSTVSEVRVVDYSVSPKPSLMWPQPATTIVSMQVDESLRTVEVMDIQGRNCGVQWERNGPILTLHVDALPPGCYEVRSDGAAPSIGRFVKH